MHTKIEITGYENNFEYLEDEMKLLDLSLYLKIQQMKRVDDAKYDELKGLFISVDEAMVLLKDRQKNHVNDEEFINILNQYELFAKYIQDMRRYCDERNQFLPMNYLQKVFQLSPFEEKCILLCLAYELDRKYEKLFAFIQDDLNKKYVTIDLLLQLFCDTQEERWDAKKYFLSHEKLMEYFFVSEDDQDFTTSLSRKVKLDERIVYFLLEIELTDTSLLEIGEIVYPNDPLPPLLVHESFQAKLRHYATYSANEPNNEGKNFAFIIYGNRGVGKKLHVKWFCKQFYYSLIVINVKHLSSQIKTYRKQIKKIVRETILQRAVLCFEHVDTLFNDENAKERIRILLKSVNDLNSYVFLLAEERISYDIQTLLNEKILIEHDLQNPDEYERTMLWKKFAKKYPLSDGISFQQIGTMFFYTPGQINDTLRLANEKRKWLKEEKITFSHIISASYERVHHHFTTKAVRIEPKYEWEDLVLPKEQIESLKDACNQVKYRNIVYSDWGFGKKLSYGKGISMLFTGPPGTGKTMSAEVVANELKLHILKVDLSQVVSKYIGETEKNLKEIFEQAELTNTILFFDETDALFGKRSQVKDARDKYANIEVAYLLQKMEEHRGITILATNFLENIDEAFLRRINYIIHFTFPNVEQREEIWRKMFPKQAPISADIDFTFLAEKIPAAGGNIKNIVLSAAFLAADLREEIGMKHLIKAAKQEMRKSGKILLPDDLGEYFYFDDV